MMKNIIKPCKPQVKHPASIAWDVWIQTKAGRECSAPENFIAREYVEYLENRLRRAFQAGYDAAERGRSAIAALTDDQ